MKIFLLVLFFELFFLQSYSQVNFEKAYFIDNNGIRTECFIKNKDLYNNPNSFEYKRNQDESIVKVGDITNVKEFGIINSIKFERVSVKMDMSSINLDKLSEVREPEWKDKTLFLKVLIDGEATLYEYKDENLKRYFYKLNNSPVEQLIYKRYFLENSGHTVSAVNIDFQKQLWTNLLCDSTTMDEVIKLEYKSEDLSDYFGGYNKCKNNVFIDYRKKAVKGSFNIKAKGGITSSSLQIPYSSSANIKLGSKTSFNLGSEIEYMIPFNRNKWSGFSEISYQEYQVEKTITVPSSSGILFENSYKFNVSYKYFDLVFGLKHYMYLNDNSSLLIKAGYVFGLPMNSTIEIDNNLYRKISNSEGLTFGAGYSFKSKYNLEFRMSSNHLDKYYGYSQFDSFSLVFGYTLYNNKKK
jgi:hypothetical protein